MKTNIAYKSLVITTQIMALLIGLLLITATVVKADNDTDTVLNYADIDDDNDGIADTVENPYLSLTMEPSFLGLGDIDELGSGTHTSTGNDINALWGLPNGSVIVDITNAGSNAVDNWTTANGQDTRFQFSGTHQVELTISQGLNLNDTGDYDGFYANDGTLYDSDYSLEAGYVDNFVFPLYSVMADGSEDGSNVDQFIWHSRGAANDVTVTSTNTPAWNNNYGILVMPLLDTDGDGVADKYDLDSDNDGISDLLEASSGVSLLANAGGIYTGGVDANGLASSLLGTPISPTSTDADTARDYRDLDSDDDGIPDALEAQLTVGYINPTHVSNVSNNGVNDTGLFVPINTDGVDTPDYIDADSDNDSLLDAAELSAALTPTYADVDASELAVNLQNDDLPATAEVDFREAEALPLIDQAVLVGITEANKTAYPVSGTCASVGDSIVVTFTDKDNNSVSSSTACQSGGVYTVTLGISALDYLNSVAVESVVNDGINPALSDDELLFVITATDNVLAPSGSPAAYGAIAGMALVFMAVGALVYPSPSQKE